MFVAQGTPPLTVISICPSADPAVDSLPTLEDTEITNGSVNVTDAVSEHPLFVSVTIHV